MNELLTNFGLWFLSTVVVAILVNVFSGIITEPIKRWLDNRSLVSRRKSIDNLQKDLYKAKLYHADINLGYLRLIREFSYVLPLIPICVISYNIGAELSSSINEGDTHLLTLLFTYLMFFAMILSLILIFKIGITIDNFTRVLVNYDKFEAETLQRIAELESKANPNKQ